VQDALSRCKARELELCGHLYRLHEDYNIVLANLCKDTYDKSMWLVVRGERDGGADRTICLGRDSSQVQVNSMRAESYMHC
jgi:hypothetical protein